MSAAVSWLAEAASTSCSRAVSGLSPSVIAAAASSGSTARPAGSRPRGSRPPARVAGASLSRKPVAPSVERPAQVARPAERREDQRRASRAPRVQASPPTVIPSRPGHLDVEQRDVRPSARRAAATHLVAALDLGDDLDVALEREQARERAADHRLVLGDQDADHARRQRHGQPEPEPALRPRARLERRRAVAAPARASPVRPLPRESCAVPPLAVVLDLDGGARAVGSDADRAVLARGCGGRRSSRPRARPRRAPPRRPRAARPRCVLELAVDPRRGERRAARPRARRASARRR